MLRIFPEEDNNIIAACFTLMIGMIWSADNFIHLFQKDVTFRFLDFVFPSFALIVIPLISLCFAIFWLIRNFSLLGVLSVILNIVAIITGKLVLPIISSVKK